MLGNLVRTKWLFTVFAMLTAVALLGCAQKYKLEFIEFESGETLYGGFDDWDERVWVVMPDGTRLEGDYVESRDYRGLGFTALLRNPDTKLMMEVFVHTQFNRGLGEARTNDGRRYKVVF